MLKKIICPSVVFMTLLSFSAYGFHGEEKKPRQENLEEVIFTEADPTEESIDQHDEKKEEFVCIAEEIEQEKKEEVVVTFCNDEKKEKEEKEENEPVLV